MVMNALGQVSPDAPQGAWQVLAQEETFDRAPGGQVVPGVKVSFVTAGGVHASIFVPNSLYSPDNVRAAVAARAHQLDTVQGMSG